MNTPSNEIDDVIQGLYDEVHQLENGILEICYFMKGSIPLDQAYNLTSSQIKKIYTISKELNPKS